MSDILSQADDERTRQKDERSYVVPIGVEQADAIRAGSLGFPRASSTETAYGYYYRSYAKDCTPLMRAWVSRSLREFSAMFELTAETEHDARIVAEELATREIGRLLLPYETRLIRETIRDVVVARIALHRAELRQS